MGTVPAGNMAGLNQTNPALTSTAPTARPLGVTAGIPSAVSTAAPIAGGAAPSSTNPFMFGGGVPGASSSIPPATPGTQTASGSTLQDYNLNKQWTDIYGQGTGGTMVNMFQGMSGTESDIYKQWLASMQPQYATAEANLKQGMGAAGISPNSTVATQSEALLQANELAQQGGVEAQLMQQNQQNQLQMLTGTEQASAAETASSGWDVFGNILGDVAGVVGMFPGVGTAIGAGLKGIGGLFSKGGGGVPTSTPGFDSENPYGK